MSAPEDEGFLARWSRRKGEVQSAPEPEATPAAPAESDEPPFDITSLPSIDSLTGASDIKAFLQKGVPAALRNAALQKMWVADESIRTYIGPSEMSWDFNAEGAIYGHGPIAPESDIVTMLKDIADHEHLKPKPAPEPETEAESQVAVEGAHEPAPAEPPRETAADDCSSPQTDDLPASLESKRRHGGATPR